MSEKEILNRLRGIEVELSPENLTCDGELSHLQVMRKQNCLLQEQRRLVKLLGCEPSDTELYPEIFGRKN